jgi:hypothetical protein
VPLSFFSIITGLIGLGFALGGLDNIRGLADWLYVLGVSVASLALMQCGVWMIPTEDRE